LIDYDLILLVGYKHRDKRINVQTHKWTNEVK
jgi:hypothetical protein